MTWWHIPVYLIDLVAMVYLSFLLGNLVDALDKKTKISGAFIGGVLLAAVTSLPELFTALSSIFLVNEPEYVVGDILGSIIFDLVLLAVETLCFVRTFRNGKLQKFHLVNGIICLAMYGLAAYAFFAPTKAQVMLGDINLMSVLIFILYVVSLFIQPKEKKMMLKKRKRKRTLRRRESIPECQESLVCLCYLLSRPYRHINCLNLSHQVLTAGLSCPHRFCRRCIASWYRNFDSRNHLHLPALQKEELRCRFRKYDWFLYI